MFYWTVLIIDVKNVGAGHFMDMLPNCPFWDNLSKLKPNLKLL